MNLSHELAQLRLGWLELNEISAKASDLDALEVFEMPPPPTVHVRALIRHIEPAPFTFIDETQAY